MRLIIDDYGTYIHKKGNRFIISNPAHQKEFSADIVSQILVYKGAAVTSAAVALAVEKGIDIVFFDRTGKPFARTYSCKFENSASIHRSQIKAYESGKGISLMKSITEAKIRNQSFLLKILAKDRNNEQLKVHAENLMNLIEKLECGRTIEEARQKFMGMEGEASRQYFHALQYVLPQDIYKGQRTRQPPQDLFNALLGYGYGVLFTEIEKACILSGLDPYMGFLHADRPGKPSMVLDMMEEFRQPVVDRSMITLVSKKIVQQNNIRPFENGYYLDKFAKHKVVESVVTRLSNIITYKNFRHSFSSLILQQARAVVRFICGEINVYSPFIYVR
jgi:CRISPR-associated protein Cas1